MTSPTAVFLYDNLDENLLASLTKEAEDFFTEPVFMQADAFTPLEDGIYTSLGRKPADILNNHNLRFYNWNLLFDKLGPNDTEGEVQKKFRERLKILSAIYRVKPSRLTEEFHESLRVHNLAESARFYTWLFGVQPKEFTHRYVTFLRDDPKMNFVLVVADGRELNHDTLYHLGMGTASKEAVIESYYQALEQNFTVEKPPRTTWRGTPLHELWLKDPDGNLIEIYARLTESELTEMPADKEPTFLVSP